MIVDRDRDNCFIRFWLWYF